jgi:hypothetical protein
MDRRIVPGVGQFGIQGPEAADEAAGVLGDRFGEVAPRRADRADDGDRACWPPSVVTAPPRS